MTRRVDAPTKSTYDYVAPLIYPMVDLAVNSTNSTGEVEAYYLSAQPMLISMEFFRHCPGCGRRFHIVLVDKKEVGDYDTSAPGPITMIGGRGVAIVGKGAPMVFDSKEFQYRYRCKHCGHEWTETRLKDTDVTELKDQDIETDEEGELD